MGINLHDYYSQKQVMKMLGLRFRQQIKRWRDENNPRSIIICGKRFYYYRDVDNYLHKLADAGLIDRYEVIKLQVKTIRYALDLDEWVPRCLAVERWPYSYETLYEHTKGHSPIPLIRTRTVYGKLFFNVKDIDKVVEYNKKHATN